MPVEIDSQQCKDLVCEAYNSQQCQYVRSDSLPAGVTIIPGSGSLLEYPISNFCGNMNEGRLLLQDLQNRDVCPRVYEGDSFCFRDCCEYQTGSKSNYIKGSLVIVDATEACDTGAQG